jgi:hypothetical protein
LYILSHKTIEAAIYSAKFIINANDHNIRHINMFNCITESETENLLKTETKMDNNIKAKLKVKFPNRHLSPNNIDCFIELPKNKSGIAYKASKSYISDIINRINDNFIVNNSNSPMKYKISIGL